MKTLFTNARIIDPEAMVEFSGALEITDDKISNIFNTPSPQKTTHTHSIDCKGRCLAPGIIDIGVKIDEPGERYTDSFSSVGQAAAAGGITTIVLRPDANPIIDNPENLEFILRNAASDCPVNVLSMASLTKNCAGIEMAEIGFLKDAGAVAFCDGMHVIGNNKILQRCLTYAKGLDALTILHPQDPVLSKGACATSGALATKLGLPSVSPIAERMGLERDLALAELTGARVHFDQLTCETSLRVMKYAKKRGLFVTAGTSIHHLTLNELDTENYPSFFKFKPPLRSENDRLALISALETGIIDIISSMHTPQNEQSKRQPYEEAASGAIGLETLLPAVLQLVHRNYIDLPHLWRALSFNPAKLIHCDAGRIAIGAPADLILFDPDKPFVLDRTKLKSKSRNTPYDGRCMQGRILQTYVAGNEIYHQ